MTLPLRARAIDLACSGGAALVVAGLSGIPGRRLLNGRRNGSPLKLVFFLYHAAASCDKDNHHPQTCLDLLKALLPKTNRSGDTLIRRSREYASVQRLVRDGVDQRGSEKALDVAPIGVQHLDRWRKFL